MAYSFRIFDSINDVELADWERVRCECGGSIFMDPRFIAAVETSMKPTFRFWYIIVYDDKSYPVASACLFAMSVDLVDFADPRLVWIVQQMPKMLSRLARWRVLICGLPGVPGEKTLAVIPTRATPQILSLIDEVIGSLAAKMKVNAVAYKEFGNDDLEWTSPLVDLGYRRLPTPPMHFFVPRFENFTQYCAALKKHYRQHIKYSLKKLQQACGETSVLTDPAEILRLYTPDVHNLYCQVVAKSDIKLEVLPIEFFRQLASRLEGEVDLVTISRQSKILAFAWCMKDGLRYHLMYGGVDYARNHEIDLYFNIAYAAIDRALQRRPSKIYVGQTANAFKAKLGCHSEPRYALVKGVGLLMSRVVKYGAPFLVVQKPANPPHKIFKETLVERAQDRTPRVSRGSGQSVDEHPN
jgi:predicted N-acyltransferase